ncbi:3-hydroxyisobutyrate dehydrogenase [Alcanivorax sp. 1008]|uniref:3-hydroxyisobutyrate dehydrogenase n=1 Tax=Alcanivorax sp. 1008 TaxID=2816853 RepID=UPI001D2E01A3|nr:3-hydroxyisobutyrate dehydrogenase [Alcanivorax sp. 1008]MCC1495595.1 3-hydroxyisobutyrate dehydrogenase [Alcanivorax sp. 1008]
MKIAFFGLGHMGGPMATNLLKAGHELTVFDLQSALVDGLAAQGAIAVQQPADAVIDADVVISMLPSGKAVSSLYLGEQGILRHIASSALVIDCSTIDAATAKHVSRQAQQAGISMIDAPVSGGVAGAAAGTLTFICGGSEEQVAQAEPVLLQMGKKVFRAGDHGAGQTAKLCNNMLLAIHMIGTCEALQLGADHGLDPKVLSEIMLASSGRNWSLELYNPWPGVMENAPASRGYAGGFAVNLMNKDLGLAVEAAMDSGTNTPLGALAKSLYALHASEGSGQLDFSSIQQMFARDS